MSETATETARLAALGVFDLRREARAKLGPGAWISSASRDVLTAALLAGHAPTAASSFASGKQAASQDAGAAIAAAIAAAMEAATPALDADAVAAIVDERLAATPPAVDADKVRAIVAEALAASDRPVTVAVTRRSGETVKLDGPQHPIAARVARACASGIRTWIHGEAGTGKTTLARTIAEAAGLKVFCQPPSLTRYDVLGYIDAHGKTVETPTSLFVRHDGPKCLLFDEVDSWGDGAQLAANLMLANGHASLPDGEMTINRTGDHVWIVATANTTGGGATSTFTGRKRMDGAFRDRFDLYPRMGLHEATERRIADGIIVGATDVDAATKTNAARAIDASQRVRAYLTSNGIDAPWSPRKTFALVKMALDGDALADAFADALGALTPAQLTAALAAARV